MYRIMYRKNDARYKTKFVALWYSSIQERSLIIYLSYLANLYYNYDTKCVYLYREEENRKFEVRHLNYTQK